MDTLVSLCKRRGFIFQSSEIYGGTGSCWDYGPLGVELKNNIKRALVAGLRPAPRRTWSASTRPSSCTHGVEGERPRRPLHRPHGGLPRVPPSLPRRPGRRDAVDALLPRRPRATSSRSPPGEACSHCGARRTLCPDCGKGELTRAAPVQPHVQDVHGAGRGGRRRSPTCGPETAQGIFVNFDNVLQSMRRKLPFGIAQIGKAFRNEITPGNFIFRTREFEQMEIEYFVNPRETVDGQPGRRVLARALDRGLPRLVPALRAARGEPAAARARARTSWRTTPSARADIEYRFPIGWSELDGHRQPHRLRPQAAREVQRQDADLLRRGAQGARRALRDRALGGRGPRPPRLPGRRLPRGGGPGREARRPALPPRAGAGEGGGAAAAQEARRHRAGGARDPRRLSRGTGPSSTTTPRPSAGSIAGRTRSARRTASPWTCRRSATATRASRPTAR